MFPGERLVCNHLRRCSIASVHSLLVPRTSHHRPIIIPPSSSPLSHQIHAFHLSCLRHLRRYPFESIQPLLNTHHIVQSSCLHHLRLYSINSIRPLLIPSSHNRPIIMPSSSCPQVKISPNRGLYRSCFTPPCSCPNKDIGPDLTMSVMTS